MYLLLLTFSLSGVNSGGGGSAQVTSVPASAVPYNLSVKAHVSSPRPISKVESNCPLDPLNYLNPEQTQAMVRFICLTVYVC